MEVQFLSSKMRVGKLGPSNAVFRARASNPGTSELGFSLIELVIVIAILGILTAIAFPAFKGIQRQAQVAQAKNALATLVKECVVAELRGKPTTLSNIQASKASLSGYRLSNAGISQGSPGYANSECFTSVVYPPNTPAERGVVVFAEPLQLVPGETYPAYPQLMLFFKQPSGTMDKLCRYWWGDPRVNSDGCRADDPVGSLWVNGGLPSPQFVEGKWN